MTAAEAFQTHYLPMSLLACLLDRFAKQNTLIDIPMCWCTVGTILSYDAAVLVPWDNDAARNC